MLIKDDNVMETSRDTLSVLSNEVIIELFRHYGVDVVFVLRWYYIRCSFK